MIWEILVIFLLIFLNGFFALAEMAVVSARRGRLQQMAEEGRAGARVALALAEHPGRFLSAIQTGITLIGIIAGAFGGATLSGHLAEFLQTVPALAAMAEELAFGLVVAAITYLSLIIGELVPKRVALLRAEKLAVAVAPVLAGVAWVTAPLVWFLGASTEGVLRLFRLPVVSENSVTEEEVKTLIAEGTETGVFERAEQQMIEAVLKLSDRTARTIMTPRPDVTWLDMNDPPETLWQEIRASGHTRYPVCRGDFDEVLGVVQSKDLLEQAVSETPLDLGAILAPALIVPDTTPVLRLLELFKAHSQHMAVVVDEYGSVEGVVSLSDILTSIAGLVPDAGDETEDAFARREDGSWLVDGMTPIEEVESRLGIKGLYGGGDFHTLAGFLLSRFGRVPRAGEFFLWQGIQFEVVDMDGRRIDKVLIRLVATPADPAMDLAASQAGRDAANRSRT